MPARCVLALLLLSCLVGTAWARGPWRAGAGNTTGWQLMTPEERVEHQRRILALAQYRECHFGLRLAAHQLDRLVETHAFHGHAVETADQVAGLYAGMDLAKHY